MATIDLHQAEAPARQRVAIVAGVAALLTVAAPLIVRVAVGSDPTDNALTRALTQADHRFAVLIGAGVSVLGLLGITYVLDFLLRATAARDRVAPWVRPTLLIGGIGLAIFSGALQVVTAIRLEHWATHGTQTWEELKKASDYGALVYLGVIFQFAFAIGFILVCLNAMRYGLLTRFLGYLGVLSAVLFVIALLPIPIVQAYWLATMAFLLWNVGGAREPPAWAAGRSVAWPSAAEMREERVRAAEARRGGGTAEPEPEPEPEAAVIEPADDAATAGAANGASSASPAGSRRKRKRR
ncbi:MAG TPA: hypothetical protein VGM91_22725 [Conexibacter sp.]|jgi:hypothetical protein